MLKEIDLLEERLRMQCAREEKDETLGEEEPKERHLARESLNQLVETQQNFLANMQTQQQQFMLQLQQQSPSTGNCTKI